MMTTAAMCIAAAGVSASEIELPREITPQIRTACEADVRRLCIRPSSTQMTVKICVLANLGNLNANCRKRLETAGLI